MLVNRTVESLRRMRLTGMADVFLAQNQDPGYRELPFEERFSLLVDQEATYREDRRLKRLLKGADFKTPAVTSNLDFSRWTEVFGDEGMTAALIDPLVHRGHVFTTSGDRYRFKESPRMAKES